jgi:two-component SAPR family response regulator
MTDPRRPIRRPDEDEQDRVRNIVHTHLLEVTAKGAKAVGCTGASFVMMGMGVWAAELSELDQKATAQLLSALGDLYHPASNDGQKRRAEKRRRQAVERLHAAIDIAMATPGGSA